jgi:hypothetical protein
MASVWTALAIESSAVFVVAASLATWARRGFPTRLSALRNKAAK